MSESTPLLDLPFIMAAQAQKHVTHNDALLGLDALVQLSVLSRAAADPPASPSEGDRYLVASPATGDWTGKENAIAAFQDGVWQFHTPKAGWRLWIADETRFLVHDGSQWRSVLASADLQSLSLLGVNTTADATNKLAVASDAVLFNHDGSDSQVKVNKSASGDTASHLFQTGFSGRAEFGLTGDDDFHAKVSPDGSTWYDGLLVDKDSGIVTFPSGVGGPGGVGPIVVDMTTTAPPGSPSAGDAYVVAATAAGDWAGHEDDIALYNGSGWTYRTPGEGWSIYNLDDGLVYAFDGSAWGAVVGGQAYENGTWTPAVTFSTPGDFSPAYTTQDGWYERIGNFNFIGLDLQFDSNAYTTAAGTFEVHGLPFPRTSSNGAFATLPLAALQKFVLGSAYAPVPAMYKGFDYLIFKMATSGGGAPNAGTGFVPASTSGFKIQLSGWYEIA